MSQVLFVIKTKEEFMRSKLFQIALPIIALASMVQSGLIAAENPGTAGQGSGSDDSKYVGLWLGSYSADTGRTAKLSYTLSKDEKGQWRGTVKYTEKNEEHAAEFTLLQIADGKLKGKLESPNGQDEITMEGQFQGEKLEGTYAISPKGSTEIIARGTWKVAKSAAAKTEQ
jgi:hypothetical protein